MTVAPSTYAYMLSLCILSIQQTDRFLLKRFRIVHVSVLTGLSKAEKRDVKSVYLMNTCLVCGTRQQVAGFVIECKLVSAPCFLGIGSIQQLKLNWHVSLRPQCEQDAPFARTQPKLNGRTMGCYGCLGCQNTPIIISTSPQECIRHQVISFVGVKTWGLAIGRAQKALLGLGRGSRHALNASVCK
jgi:hypothetical protein